ncbi:hypothetical protein A2U01_0067475, partial [Trifolium medium]|nr:hypothetical protein [Trifolium medium]
HLVSDVGLVNTPTRAQHYWAWDADMNGRLSDQKTGSKHPQRIVEETRIPS